MNDEYQAVIDALRGEGWAIIAVSPERLGDADAYNLEDILWDRVDNALA